MNHGRDFITEGNSPRRHGGHGGRTEFLATYLSCSDVLRGAPPRHTQIHCCSDLAVSVRPPCPPCLRGESGVPSRAPGYPNRISDVVYTLAVPMYYPPSPTRREDHRWPIGSFCSRSLRAPRA